MISKQDEDAVTDLMRNRKLFCCHSGLNEKAPQL